MAKHRSVFLQVSRKRMTLIMVIL
uniref:Uncharacterized protein n=1 Tax=Arundo donax TaxID=35708 RepID=A0A0A8YE04_ARUDO